MRIPMISNGHLQLLNGAGGSSSIRVGSDAWFAWLRNEQNKSFSFRNHLETFTARRERLRNGWYWYAYRRNEGKLRKVYLGKTEELTLERLYAVAAILNSQENSANITSTHEPYTVKAPEHMYSFFLFCLRTLPYTFS